MDASVIWIWSHFLVLIGIFSLSLRGKRNTCIDDAGWKTLIRQAGLGSWLEIATHSDSIQFAFIASRRCIQAMNGHLNVLAVVWRAQREKYKSSLIKNIYTSFSLNDIKHKLRRIGRHLLSFLQILFSDYFLPDITRKQASQALGWLSKDNVNQSQSSSQYSDWNLNEGWKLVEHRRYYRRPLTALPPWRAWPVHIHWLSPRPCVNLVWHGHPLNRARV